MHVASNLAFVIHSASKQAFNVSSRASTRFLANSSSSEYPTNNPKNEWFVAFFNVSFGQRFPRSFFSSLVFFVSLPFFSFFSLFFFFFFFFEQTDGLPVSEEKNRDDDSERNDDAISLHPESFPPRLIACIHAWRLAFAQVNANAKGTNKRGIQI